MVLMSGRLIKHNRIICHLILSEKVQSLVEVNRTIYLGLKLYDLGNLKF